MESKKLQIITLTLAIISCLGVIVMSGVVYVKLFKNTENSERNAVVSAELTRKNFVGLPESTTVDSKGGKKIITLRGKITVGNDNPYQLSSTDAGESVKVAIDPSTKIYLITPSQTVGKAPMVAEVAFNAFSIGLLDEVYMASYESVGSDIAFDSEVAKSLTVYANK